MKCLARALTATLLLTTLVSLRAQAPAATTPGGAANDPTRPILNAEQENHWAEPAPPAHIVGPVYFVGTRGLAVYYLHTNEGGILISSGVQGSGPMIADSIRRLGFDPTQIRLLLATHAHFDHAGGMAYLQKLSGGKVAALEQEVALLESGGKTDFQYGQSAEFRFDPVHVDRVLHDGETIALGGAQISVLWMPGHTRGAASYILNAEENGKTYSVLIFGSGGVNPGYRLTGNPSYAGIAADFQHTEEVLDGLHPDIWLALHTEQFGYWEKSGRAASDGVNAWLDPEGYREFLQQRRKAVQDEIAKEKK